MISVCMATYNGAKYIKEQVDSILCQLSDGDELIVSDDGSTDETIAILKAYNDSRIKIFNNNNRKGVVGNFENALLQASGDYIFLSDQDDVWLEGKVNICIRELHNSNLVVTDCNVVDENLNLISSSFFRYNNSSPGFWRNLYKNSYLGACVAFRRDVLDLIFPFPENLPVYHEGWIASLSEIFGKVTFIPYKGINYRRHNYNVSMTCEKSKNSIIKRVKIRILFLFLIMKRVITLKSRGVNLSKYDANKE